MRYRPNSHYLSAYKAQKHNAFLRGIPFELEFSDWLTIWRNSGHLHERGCGRGQFVMARHGDVGPYSVSNVKIILHVDNLGEQKWSDERRQAASERAKGNKFARALKGRPFTEEHRRNMRKPKSEEHRRNMKGNQNALGSRRTTEQRLAIGARSSRLIREGRLFTPEHRRKGWVTRRANAAKATADQSSRGASQL